MISDLFIIIIAWFSFFLWQLVGFSTFFGLFYKKSVDAGWGFGRLICWLVISMIIWVLAHLGLPVNQPIFVYLLFIVLSVFATFQLHKHKKPLATFLKNKWQLIFIQELIFLIFFIFLCLVRAHQPRVEGLEKFMDVGFMAGYLRSPTLPAQDMWLAGEKINYYTFGHFLGATATMFLNLEVEVSYNILLGLIMGMVSVQAASLSGNLVFRLSAYAQKTHLKKIKLSSIIKASVAGGFLLVLAGNGHPSWYLIKNGSFDGYWYPDATRFIDRTIHEFPAYSFIVSDLHAHVWSMPLVIFILFSIYLWSDEILLLEKKKNRKMSCFFSRSLNSCFDSINKIFETKATDFIYKIFNLKRRQLHRQHLFSLTSQPYVWFSLLTGWLLGLAISTSTWDFLVYSLLLMIVGLIMLGYNKRLFKPLFLSALIMIIVAGITSSFWLMNFVSISEGVAIAQEKSPIWQLLVLWMPHVFISLITIVLLISLSVKTKIFSSREMMIIAMVIVSIILLILPEFIYMKDIYPNHPRANTMFKLTFQAFLMMTIVISSLAGLVGQDDLKKKIPVFQQLLSKLFLTVFILGVGYYLYFGYRDFYGGLKRYQGLDGLGWLQLESPGDYQGIIWLRDNVQGRPVVLEAVGESYTTYARVSTFTGLPTVLGWRVHQWLWRGGFDIPSARTEDVRMMYEEPLSINAQKLYGQYQVKYIFIGSKERETYAKLNESDLQQIGTVVFDKAVTKIIQL